MEGLGLWDGPFLTRSVSIAFARLAMVDCFLGGKLWKSLCKYPDTVGRRRKLPMFI